MAEDCLMLCTRGGIPQPDCIIPRKFYWLGSINEGLVGEGRINNHLLRPIKRM